MNKDLTSNSKMDDEARTTAFGLLCYAKDYVEAALNVSNRPRSCLEEMRHRISEPAYFLVGHSIELSLKAFLKGRGTALEELKRSYGHDLEMLLKEAKRRKLGNEVKLSGKDAKAIHLLNQNYKPKRFEYIVTGHKTGPKYGCIVDVAVKLVNGLRDYCYKRTFNEPLQKNRANHYAVRSAS